MSALAQSLAGVVRGRVQGSRARRDGSLMPLAGLPSAGDAATRDGRWVMNPDGILGRALWLNAGRPYTIPLSLDGEVRLRGRALMLTHDWQNGSTPIRARIAITDARGRRRTLWSQRIRPSDRGRPRGRRFDVAVPGDAVALHLELAVIGRLREGSVTRGVWLEPMLVDPRAGELPCPPSGSAATAAARARPLVSVLTPVHNPPVFMLVEAIESVLGQTFGDWELCLVDDGSSDPEVIGTLRRYADAEPRIRLARHETAQGISAASNAALALATGEYVATLDHDDLLLPAALERVAQAIAAEPELDMIYSDEAVVGDDGQYARHIKPGWSPEHMVTLMYTCHLGVYRRSLAQQIGGFQTRFDGCQDYDLVLRVMEQTDRIAHIPEILYHWRAHSASTAGGDQAKPYAYLKQPEAIGEHLRRTGIAAEVQLNQLPGMHRIVHRVDPTLSAALVLSVASAEGLTEAAASWAAQAHANWSAVLAAPAAIHGEVAAALRAAGAVADRISVVTAAPNDLVAGLDAAAGQADADHLVLIQRPAVGLTHDWLTRLLGYSAQPGIAAAGPVVLAPDGRISNSGIAIPDGLPLHIHHGAAPSAAQPVVYNVAAVSGILATPRSSYTALDGLDPALGELALVDYCLRAGASGGRTVIVPDARLRTATADTTVNDLAALRLLRRRWAAAHTHDRYYNSSFRTDRGDYIIAPFGR